MIERPDNRSYRLRGDRQTFAQANAYKRNWETFGIELRDLIDPSTLFPDCTSQIMEIGTGMGEGTALIAAAFPGTGFIGVEVHKPGVGALLGHIERLGLANLRLMEEDAHIILRDHFANESFDAFHLFFPDPWPKRRHWKRRIVQPEFLQLIHNKLKAGGYLVKLDSRGRFKSATKNDGKKTIGLENTGYFLPLISRSLMSEESVLNMIDQSLGLLVERADGKSARVEMKPRLH